MRRNGLLLAAAFCLGVAILCFAVLCGEVRAEPYQRSLWKHWTDADSDCMNTRHEVLLEESQVEATLSPDGCSVTFGMWLDPFSGETFFDPRDLDVDHLAPLKWAHEHGGEEWPAERRESYANFLEYEHHLVAVQARLNRQKGAKGPSQWIPPNSASHCWYGRAWRNIVERWELQPDTADWLAIYALLGACDAD